MQVVITMAGLGQRFKDQAHINPQYLEPKPFIQIKNRRVIEYLTDQFPADWKLFFVVNSDLDEKYIHFLQQKYPDGKVIKTAYSYRGPLDTVLAAMSFLDFQQPTLVTYCDYTLRWDAGRFEETVAAEKADAAIVGYTGFHPTFLGPNSYCHYLVKDQWVTELQEKKLYTGRLETEWTSCGLYYFRSAEFLKSCLDQQLKQQLNYNGQEYYVSLAIQAALNYSLNQNLQLKVLNYPIQHFTQLGTPFDIDWVLTNNWPLQ